MASVAASYLENWDFEHYCLTYVVSTGNSNRLGKLLRFLWSIVDFCYRSITWRPQIVHVHFGWKASFIRMAIFVILANLFQRKLVLHCHSSRFDLFYEQNPKPIQQFIRQILNKADLLLLVSQRWQEYFRTFNLSTPVYVLYNSVACPQGDFSILNRNQIILTLGRLGHRKGTYDILKAVPQVLDSYPDTEFWLAGDGDINKIQAILSKQSWGDKVKLLGWIRAEKKEQALRQGSIFLLPSYHEGLPIAILEAMAYGLPVISCPVGGIGEVVKDQTTGFLVQSGDVDGIVEKLLLLLGDVSLAQEFGEAGRNIVYENFNIHSLLGHLYAIYDSILVGNIQYVQKPSSTGR